MQWLNTQVQESDKPMFESQYSAQYLYIVRTQSILVNSIITCHSMETLQRLNRLPVSGS